MIKLILVPTDFSDNAKNAVAYAAGIARKTGARILLFNSYHLPAIPGDVPITVSEKLMKEEERNALAKLKQLASDAALKGIKADVVVKLGFAVEQIDRLSKSKKADLIVMGTKGASGLKRIIMGSNTAAVIGKVKCPVLAVPSSAAFGQIKKIIFATDYRDDKSAAIREVAEFASIFKSEINVVHFCREITTKQRSVFDGYENHLKKMIGYSKLSFKLLETQDMLEGLNVYAQAADADIIAVEKKTRTLFQKLYDRSFTKKVAYYTNKPLMAFHTKEKQNKRTK